MNPCPLLENHAGIWLFSAEQLNQDFAQGKRYASGLRNIVAMDWNPYQNQLYVVQHGRDSLHDLFPSLYTEKQSAELPAEQFLALREGFVGSWPYAYWDHFKNVFVQSPEYGGDGEKTSDQYTPPLYGFPAHYAPNDLLFYKGEQFPEKYRKGTFVAFHGSWNRLGFEQKGYHVQFLPMEDGKPSGEAEIFISGFAGDKEITASSQARYRPMGLSMLNDGSLLIVDSKEGRIWKVTF